MPFRPLRERSVRWRPVGAQGLEHCHVAPVPTGVAIRSIVIGEMDGAPFGVSYAIDCDDAWQVRALSLDVMGGPALAMTSDGRGRWFEANGAERTDLAGCIDIDLSGTPFTNTLPIRRLALRPGHGPVELSMLYVPFDTFEPFAHRQRYTALDDRRFQFDVAVGSFSAELPVDDDGLVLDYPTLFERR